ncbi:hypothetical protein AcV5_005181 [Taiwanofungus camphoratus]|nr:hypothetical protein AcV5_005181 [Antrodia cinnamomea]
MESFPSINIIPHCIILFAHATNPTPLEHPSGSASGMTWCSVLHWKCSLWWAFTVCLHSEGSLAIGPIDHFHPSSLQVWTQARTARRRESTILRAVSSLITRVMQEWCGTGGVSRLSPPSSHSLGGYSFRLIGTRMTKDWVGTFGRRIGGIKWWVFSLSSVPFSVPRVFPLSLLNQAYLNDADTYHASTMVCSHDLHGEGASASAINRSSFASLFIALTLRFAHHGVSRSQAYRARRVSSPIGRAGGHKSVGEEVVVELLEIIEYRTVVTSLDVTTYAGRRCVAALAPCSFSASWDPGLRFGEERDGHARRVGYPASPWLSGIPRQARLHPVRKRIESPIKQDSHCWATGQTLVEQRAGDQLRVASEQGSRHIQPWPCRHAGHSQCHSLFTVDECFTMLPVGDAVESLDCARRS